MKTLYQCEICNQVYSLANGAEFCELSVAPEPLFNVGDPVLVRTRYDGDEADEVVEVKLVGNEMLTGCLESWLRSDNIKGMEEFKIWLGTIKQTLHEWIYRVRENHQLGKDSESYTDWVGEYQLGGENG